MTDKEYIEYLHNSGKMPDWYYYQVNGKTFSENYIEQLNKRKADRELEKYKARRKAEIDAEIEKQIEEELTPKIEAALNDLFKDWQ